MKTALTCLALDIVIVHWRPLTAPASQPFQAMNSEPDEGEAVSVTLVPAGYSSEQKGSQEIRPVSEVTVPDPVPSSETVRRMPGSLTSSKVAVTSLASDIVTSQAPLPEQAPPQLVNSE